MLVLSFSLSEDIESSKYHTQFAFSTSITCSSVCYYPSCSGTPCSWVIGCMVLLYWALTCLSPEQEQESHYSFPVNSFPGRFQSRPGSHNRPEQDNSKVKDLKRNMKKRNTESRAMVHCSAPDCLLCNGHCRNT